MKSSCRQLASQDIASERQSREATKLSLPGGLLGTDESEAAFTDNRNFGRWLFPIGVDAAKDDLTLLASGDGVILHQTSSLPTLDAYKQEAFVR